jgi:hypothetical protein
MPLAIEEKFFRGTKSPPSEGGSPWRTSERAESHAGPMNLDPRCQPILVGNVGSEREWWRENAGVVGQGGPGRGSRGERGGIGRGRVVYPS